MGVFSNDLVGEQMNVFSVGQIGEGLKWDDEKITEAVALNNDVIGMLFDEPTAYVCDHKNVIEIDSKVVILIPWKSFVHRFW